jgi:hypothetical protein
MGWVVGGGGRCILAKLVKEKKKQKKTYHKVEAKV